MLTLSMSAFRGKSGGVEVEIVGRLTALLGENAYPNGVRGVWGKMVAEEGTRTPDTRIIIPFLVFIFQRFRLPLSQPCSVYPTMANSPAASLL